MSPPCGGMLAGNCVDLGKRAPRKGLEERTLLEGDITLRRSTLLLGQLDPDTYQRLYVEHELEMKFLTL